MLVVRRSSMKPSPPSISTSTWCLRTLIGWASSVYSIRGSAESLCRPARQMTIEETRAWLNFGVVETLHEREERDRARFGRIRDRWEKKFEDPQDVLIQADRMRRSASVKHGSR